MGKKFKVDARLIIQLGRESIKDHTTALIELIKNSYDADASKVVVDIFCKKEMPYIRVADNGFGMSEKAIDDNWLTIGFSEKKKKTSSKTGRRKTGEKGIGRIAADRLGEELKLITKTEDDPVQALKVNWNDFDTDNKSVSDIEIEEIKDIKPDLPKPRQNKKNSGTELIITTLRHKWDKDNIHDLYKELSFFTPLIDDKDKFEIRLNNDIDPSYSKPIKTAIFDVAEINLDLHFDGKNKLVYDLKNKVNGKKNRTEIFDIEKFNTRVGKNLDAKLECGPIDISLSFYPRKSAILTGTGFSLTDLRNFLEVNSGVKIYRDLVPVRPYGFSNSDFGHDWIGLAERKGKDPAGVSRPTYKVTPNQILGNVRISRDNNPEIKDSAAREGLVENEAFKQLKEIVLGSIRLLESYRYEIFDEARNKSSRNRSKNSAFKNITKNLEKVRNELQSIKVYVDTHKDYDGSPISKTILRLDEAQKETERTIEELLEEKRVLSALATLGISSAVFGHETEGAINTFKETIGNAKDFLSSKNRNISKALSNIRNAEKQAKLIAGWGTFALARIERDKKVKKLVQVEEIIKNTIDQVRPAFENFSIEFKMELSELYFHVYPMDIESIILNLLTNSFNAVPNSKDERIIKIRLYSEMIQNQSGFAIEVSDTGPGIAKEYIDKIWNPLFTTKVGDKGRSTGTGLGLTIVKSIVDELQGIVSAENDPELKGALIKVWIPNVKE